MLTKDIFLDTETAFALKTDAEIEKAYWLFSLIQKQPLVKLGTAVANFALKHHLPVEGIIRTTVFDHFCGGVTEEDSLKVVEKLFSKGVYSVLDYSVEGAQTEEDFRRAFEMTKHLIEFAGKRKEIPFAVFKPTGMGPFTVYEKVSAGQPLTPEEQRQWDRTRERYYRLFVAARDNDVPVMVDAEESWIQKAVDDMLEELMLEFNKDKPYVVNTLQMYRKDRLPYLEGLFDRTRSKGVKLGVKFVRGAYMEKERERAERLGYPSPICDTKADTDRNFNAGLRFLMDRIDADPLIYNGTHNEESSLLLANLVDEKGLRRNDPRVWFGQLYGMSDNITFNLAKLGFNTSKYIPFGPVKDVMPYLIRRAEENTSVTGQTNRELRLLEMERRRRKLV
ncbi:MAG: proline dehydrogenase [Chlorobi bacterium]|nr:proline dehydrogenase [Chlorobiota bacterium]